MTAGEAQPSWASRAALKLQAALDAFGLDVTGLECADFGCHAGGFTDCLLRRGAAKVFAVDTGYGVLDWRLRQDPRVVVMERCNALHVDPPQPVDLVTIDTGWTRQQHSVPAALRWLRPGGRIVTLVKPHYEAAALHKAGLLHGGALAPADARAVLDEVLRSFEALGARVAGTVESPLSGAKSARRARGAAAGQGNREYLVLAVPGPPADGPQTHPPA